MKGFGGNKGFIQYPKGFQSGNGLLTGVKGLQLATLLNYPIELQDGNTIAYFDFKRKVTVDASGMVKEWTDIIANTFKISQSDYTKRPLLTNEGILFDGVNDFLKSLNISLPQPTSVYLVINQIVWNNRQLIDGYTNSTLNIEQEVASPRIIMYAGVVGPQSIALPVDEYAVVIAEFNGVNSKLYISDVAAVTGNAGSAAANGLTIGSRSDGNVVSTIGVRAVVLRKIIDNSENRIKIKDFLTKINSKYNIHSQSTSFNKGKLVITVDDGTSSLYSALYPLLVSKGKKLTAYIITDLVGTTGHVTWNQLKDMHANGFDLQCHSKSHISYNTLTAEQLTEQFNAVNLAFIQNDLPEPQHSAYPFGDYNLTVYESIDGFRKTGRTTNAFAQIYRNSNKITLMSFSVDNLQAAGLTTLKSNLDLVKNNKSACIIHCHGMSETGGTYEVSTSIMTEIIDYAIANDLDIITISELYEQMLK